jgi:hypothetical protein
VDVVGLRDEQHGEGAVHHRAVEVERVAHRHHEARDLALHAEPVERLQDLRVRGFRTGRGKGQQEGFLDEHQQLEHARPEEQEARQHQHAPQQEEAQVEVAHENRELQQDAQPVHGHRGCHGGQHRERRELHHVAGDLEHRVRKFFNGRHQRPGLVAQRGQRDAEEHREHHDLQDLVVGHGLHERLRHRVAHEVLERELGGGQVGRGADVGQRQAQVLAGLEQVGHDQADDQRDQRGRQEPADGLAEHAAHRLGVAHVRDAHHQRGEHQRADQHLDEAQEHVRDDGDVVRDFLRGAFVRKAREDHVAHDDAEHHGDQDPGGHGQLLLHCVPLVVCE